MIVNNAAGKNLVGVIVAIELSGHVAGINCPRRSRLERGASFAAQKQIVVGVRPRRRGIRRL
jgi:hypothetical protein